MSEELTGTRRRVTSEDVIARRAERMLVVPFRERIAELQTRVAFATARAASGRPTDQPEAEDMLGVARTDLLELLDDIDKAVPGPGRGPAEDCRRAVRSLLERAGCRGGEPR